MTVSARTTFGMRQAAAPTPESEAPIPAQPASVASPASNRRAIAFVEPITPIALQRLAAQTAAAVGDGVDEIVLTIASPGGALLPTLELYRLLLGLPVKLQTHAVGCVASAATILMLAGSERSAHPKAKFLFHEVSAQVRPPPGTYLARSTERHRQLYELTAHEVYRARTRLPHATIEAFARGEVVFDVTAALDFEIIHHIADIDANVPAPPIGQV
jgi:ATP-dependent protease ClpP protease subunit